MSQRKESKKIPHFPIFRRYNVAAECPISVEEYVKDDRLDINLMPKKVYLEFIEWAETKASCNPIPSVDILNRARKCRLPWEIVAIANKLFLSYSVPNLDASTDQYSVPSDLGSFGDLKGEGGKLLRICNLLRKSVALTSEAETLICEGYHNQYGGKAITKGGDPNEPNPLLGNLLKAADEDGRFSSLFANFFEVRERMDGVFRELADSIENAQEIPGRPGRAKEPDWMVWAARLLSKEGFGRNEYKALLQVFEIEETDYDVPHAGEAAWRRANGQSVRDTKTGGDHDPSLPPIPCDADVELYVYLGGVPSGTYCEMYLDDQEDE